MQFKNRAESNAGFTLIELLVTIAIISIMTAIVVIKYGAFNSSVLLKSQAYELALNLREAQTFAISARGANSGTNTAFREGYGLYFASSQRSQYILFRDSGAGNGYYNTGEEVGEPFTLDPRFQIKSLKHGTCNSGTPQQFLNITFRRPDFDANIYGGATYACITIASVANMNMTRSVEVSATGQISVKSE